MSYTKTNNNNNAVSTSTEGVTIGTRSKNGTVVTYSITISSSVQSFDLSITNSATSNTRIDDIVLKGTVGTAPTKPTISAGKESETISAGALEASINGVKLVNALDNLGITATTDAEWLSVAFTAGSFETGAKLTATANSYYHESEARTATVTLKATGVTKTVTFKQNPSIVNNPSALTVTPGDKTFSVAWEGDSKAASYVAYYSTTDLSEGNPATDGIEMTVSNTGSAYTAAPAQTLTNRTTYYVYVKVNTLTSAYAEKYVISNVWATTTAVPIGEVEVETVSAPYSQMFKEDGQGLFVEDIVNDGGSGAHIWTSSSSYGMMATGYIERQRYVTEAWLYSPKIQIPSSMTNPYVSFKHIGNYFGSTANMKADLKVYIREVGGEWGLMDVPYPAGNTFDEDWTVVDFALTSYVGKTVQFRWLYTSSSTRSGTYEMDEFKVYDKQGSGDSYVAVPKQTINFSTLYSENTVLDGVTIGGDNCSLVFNKRDGGTATQYYTNGQAVRWYGGGTLAITASSGHKITSIKINYSQTANSVSANKGSYSLADNVGTWIGEVSDGGSVIFTQSGTTGQCRITSIEIN